MYHNWQEDARRGSRIAEVHRILRNPLQDSAEDKVNQLSKRHDLLHDTPGMRGTLGSFITVKVNPSNIHICVKKGVQEQALQMLSQRILEHAKSGPTRLVLKRSQRGKYIYSEWISTKALAGMDVQALLDRLLKQTRTRKKYITFILKQQHVGGAIHTRIQKGRTLL